MVLVGWKLPWVALTPEPATDLAKGTRVISCPFTGILICGSGEARATEKVPIDCTLSAVEFRSWVWP